MSRNGFDRSTPANVAQTMAEDALAANTSGLLTTRQNAKYFSGARCSIKVNKRLFTFAFSISWNIETEVSEIRTVDSVTAFELGPRRVSVEGTIGSFILPGSSPQAEIQQADMLSFIFDKYVTIEVRDSVTDNIIFKTNRAIITRSQGSVGPDSLGNMQLQWKAIDWMNESYPDYPISDAKVNPNFSYDFVSGSDPTKQ